MKVRVNGEEVVVAGGVSLAALLARMKVCAERVVIEYNRRILASQEWDGVLLKEGDHLEIVSFVGGG